MVKYEVMFYFGVYHVNPFLMPSEVVEVEVDKTLGEKDIIACALMKLKGNCPRTYSTQLKKVI